MTEPKYPAERLPPQYRTLQLTLSSVAFERLQNLVDSGLFGKTIEECAAELLRHRLREVFR